MPHLRIREIMDALNASGLSADQHVLVTELVAVCFMASMGGGPGTPRQDRNKRYYDNKRLKASETVLIKTDATDKEKVSHTLPKENNNINIPTRERTREARGKRLPNDWTPTGCLFSWATSEMGLPRAVVDFETAAFCDHFWASARANATKIDWGRAWKNWMREASRRGRTTGPPQASIRTSVSQELLEEMRERDAATIIDLNAHRRIESRNHSDSPVPEGDGGDGGKDGGGADSVLSESKSSRSSGREGLSAPIDRTDDRG